MTLTQRASATAWRRISRLALLASIVESVDDAIISETLDGIITSWNPAAARIYGYSAEEVVDRLFSMLLPPEKAEEMSGVLDRISDGMPVERYDTVRLRKNGAHIPVSRMVSPVRDGGGNVLGVVAAARDITARKRAEREIAELEARVRAAEHGS